MPGPRKRLRSSEPRSTLPYGLGCGEGLLSLVQLLPALFRRLRPEDHARLAQRISSWQAEVQASRIRLDTWSSGRSAPIPGPAGLERLSQALAVKRELGLEVYARPERVRVGCSPRRRVAREGRIELVRFAPLREGKRRGDPILVIYSWINRPTILDLLPGDSLVEHLIRQGLDVFQLEWGTPDPRLELEALIADVLGAFLDRIRTVTGAPRVSLLGHCLGGDLALLAAAAHADRVGRVAALTTPVAAPREGAVALGLDPGLGAVEAVLERHGNFPGKVMRAAFLALRPEEETIRWMRFVESLDDPRAHHRFLAVDRWSNENVDVPGALFRRLVEEVYRSGNLLAGRVPIRGRRLGLPQVRCPVLNVLARRDWIVPAATARPLDRTVSGPAERLEVPGSHLAFLLDRRSRGGWTRMSDFLLGHDRDPKGGVKRRAGNGVRESRTGPAGRRPARPRPSRRTRSRSRSRPT